MFKRSMKIIILLIIFSINLFFLLDITLFKRVIKESYIDEDIKMDAKVDVYDDNQKIISEDETYLLEDITRFKINYTFDKNYSKDYEAESSIKARVYLKKVIDNKVLSEKSFLLDEKTFNNKAINTLEFNLDKDYLDRFIYTNFKDSSNLKIKLVISNDTKISFSNFKHMINEDIHIDIPYERIVRIEKTSFHLKRKLPVKINDSLKLKVYFIISLLILIITSFFLYLELLNYYRLISLNTYENIIKRIKANYKDQYIELSKMPDISGKHILEVKTLNDLDTVFKETNDLVNVVETKKDKELIFFVISDDKVYMYKVLNKAHLPKKTLK